MDLKLKELRKAAGYKSARAYAEHLGWNVRSYTNYEQETRQLSLEQACVICNDLGCTLDALCGRSGAQETKPYVQYVYENLNTEGQISLTQQAQMHAANPLFQHKRGEGQIRVGEEVS